MSQSILGRQLAKKRSSTVRQYVPDVGDVVWLHFDPQLGHEQRGRRPALVLSPASYNAKTGLMLCCPMTHQVKGYPFEVLITQNPPSAVLADQIKSLDWVHRQAAFKEKAAAELVGDVKRKIYALLGRPGAD